MGARQTREEDEARSGAVEGERSRVSARSRDAAARGRRSGGAAGAGSAQASGKASAPSEPTRWDRERAMKAGTPDAIPESGPRAQRVKEVVHEKTPEKLKNPSDLQVRFRTGVVYVTLSILCIIISNWTLLAFLVVTAAICSGEFFYMLRSDAKLPNEIVGIVGAACFPISVFFLGLPGAIYVSLLLMIALIVWYVFYQPARVQDVAVSYFGATYCGLLLCGLLVIRMALPRPWGAVLVLLLFLSVWANDAFAYLIGRKFGRHKLAPRVSPKKSWEGFIAGLVGSALVWCAMAYVPGVSMNLWEAVLFGLVAGAMGVLGDLAESRIKRNSGFKDSGTIMPGHGGLLDRCDSLFTVSVTAVVLLVAFGCIPVTLF